MRLGDWDTYERDAGVATAGGNPTALLMAEHDWLRSALVDVEKALHADADGAVASLGSDPQKVDVFIDLHIRKEEEVYLPVLEPLLIAEGLAVDFQSLYAEHDAIKEWQGICWTRSSAQGV